MRSSIPVKTAMSYRSATFVKLEDYDIRAPILGMGREMAISRRIRILFVTTTDLHDLERTVLLAPLLDQVNCVGKSVDQGHGNHRGCPYFATVQPVAVARILRVTATLYAFKEPSASGPLHQTIDVTDKNILGVRVILGALFALLIALPIGGKSTLVVYQAFLAERPVPTIEDWMIALLPFMLGFSTTLVLAIFNRIIAGISTLFGISSGTSARDD
jgi:hypothetical protein